MDPINQSFIGINMNNVAKSEVVLGNLYVIAAPSGGGKTSLVRALVSELSQLEISISHTTRPIKPGEKEGKDYFYLSNDAFNQMVMQNAFVEYAEVFGYFYGTSKAQIEERLTRNIDIMLDIDWQGARAIKHLFPAAVSIFLIPPTLQVLKDRLNQRKRDEVAIVESRMQQAQAELSHYEEFDYLVVNDDFTDALSAVKSIVLANRLSMPKQKIKQAKLLSLLFAKE